MSFILTSMAPQLVAEGIEKLRKDADVRRKAAYQEREDYFHGRTLTKLTRHIAEGAQAWSERQTFFTDCGVTNRIGSTLLAALWGKEIERIVSESETEQAAFDLIYKLSRIDQKQRAWGQNQVVPGDGFSLVSFSERLGRVIVHSVDPCNITVETDPDDPLSAITVIEKRINPNKAGEFVEWVWNVEAYCCIDQNQSFVVPWTPNPYGVIPYSHLPGLLMSESYWGRSPLEGVIQCHKRANNLRSEEELGIRYEAHSMLKVADDFADAVMKSGPTNFIALSKGGDAAYINPGADLAAITAAYRRSWEEGFEIGGIPMSIVRGGSAASGYALEIEYRSMQELVADLRVSAIAFEEETAQKTCIVHNVHIGGLPQNPDVHIEMDTSVIPRDKQTERDQDWLEVQGGALKMADYLRKWRPEIEDPDAYAAELDVTKPMPAVPAAAGGGFLL